MNTKLVLTALLISSLLSAAFFHFFPFYLLFIPIPGIIFGIIMVIIYNLLNFPVTKLRSFLVFLMVKLKKKYQILVFLKKKWLILVRKYQILVFLKEKYR
jgi:hypothetical protein